jgi:acyl-ACP thioesterase
VEPRRRIEHEYRVRFDEANAEGWLRPSGLLRFAQDMAWRHSTEAGFDRAWYEERGMNWLVRNVKVSITEPITYGDVLAISTEVVGWRYVWARRHSDVRRVGSEDGRGSEARMATVQTDWVLLTDEGRPAKTPPEIAHYFSPDQQFKRDRVVLPDPGERAWVTTLATRVRPLDVDPMRHMNNAAYVDMVDDGIGQLPDGQRLLAPDCYRIGYVAPALPGTPIEISCWRVSETQIACRISGADGTELTKALVGRRD